MFGFLMGTLQKFKEKEDANKQTEKVSVELSIGSNIDDRVP